MDKIMSKIVNDQLIEYIEKHHILNDKQYGFRSKSNTATALFDLITKIQNYRDINRTVALIFIDLQKAFDTVKRELLIQKLWEIGIRSKAYKWFQSYLSDRKQYININGIITEKLLVEEGVEHVQKQYINQRIMHYFTVK